MIKALNLITLVALVSSTGCATLSLSPLSTDEPDGEIRLKESPEARLFRTIETAREKNAIVLQVEGAEKPVRMIPLPADGKSVFMNDLVRQAGLIKRFGTPDVTLFRNGNQVMDGIKMKVLFDKKSKRVKPGTDYSLRPGDRIVVRDDASFGLSEIFDELVPQVTREAAFR